MDLTSAFQIGSDIQRILKCQVYPAITVRSVVGRLNAEGRASVHILYLDAGGTSVRYCEKTEPFSASIALRRPENPTAQVKTRIEYINCRAVSHGGSISTAHFPYARAYMI